MSASLVCSRVGSFLSTYVIFLVSTTNKQKCVDGKIGGNILLRIGLDQK